MTNPRNRRRSGQSMIEFQLVIVLFLLTLFGTFEICRLLLSYTTLANAARVGVRYATTHGGSNNSGGSTCADLYITTAQCVTDTVRDFTAGSMINPSQVNVTTTGVGGAPGTVVRVQITYPYQPFILLPMSTDLGTQTEGIITY